jgi:alpha-L-fucosidase
MGDYDSAGDNQISMGATKRPWETPVTMNDTWGFKKDDHNWKSAQILIRQLATTSSRGGNYLLNVGPTSEGVIPPESVARLAEVGKWMKANSDSIYSTSASPFPYDFSWGVITSKPGHLYLHVFNWPQKDLVLYGIQSKVEHATLLANHAAVKFTQNKEQPGTFPTLTISLPPQAPDPNDSVIELDLTGALNVDTSLLQQPDRTINLAAQLGNLHKSEGSEVRFDSRGVAEHWTRAGDSLEWSFKVNHPGEFDVELITSQQKYGNGWDGGQHVNITVGKRELSGLVGDNGKQDNPANPYWPYDISKMGKVRLDQAATYTVSLKPDKIPDGQKYGLTLVTLRLVPAK